MDKKIGFIGTGQMASALAAGFIETKTIDAANLFGYDVLPAAAQAFAAKTGGTVFATIKEVVAKSDIVILCVKPQQLAEVLQQLSPLHAHGLNPLWITIAAGVPIKNYLKQLGTSARLIRVMPNTPAMVHEAACGFSASEGATTEDVELTQTLFSTIGIAFQVPERRLDAVTGLSGSGPAYVYMMIEALADGGVKMGLPRDLSMQLAAQTVLGSAKMVLETGEHPGVLKDKVASPRGTTIYGIHALEENGFRAALIDAVEAATRRANELASEF